MLICGIDDAGKGPVVGPMVLAGILIDGKDLDKLKKLNVRDSKLLTRKRREFLYKKILKICKKYKVIIIKVKEIDGKDHHGLNLNDLEAVKSAEIINYLKPDKAIIDCPSPNIKAWKNYVYERLKKKIELIVEHKADQKFLECSGASIIAKFNRDKEIDKIKKIVGHDFGSGYSHDERTIKFLEENIDKYPEFFRKSWQTWKNHKSRKEQRKIEEF